MNRCCILLFILISLSRTVGAQDTLPNFSVKDYGNKRYIIGWVNTYGLVKQISIQRSHDSLKNYTTIMSVADPNARQNGYADAKAPNDHMFYRLFVVLDKGQFYFTDARKPVFDSIKMTKKVTIDYTKDSVVSSNIKPVIPKKPDFIPSFFVYTNRDGYVYINLPDADRKKYHIKFYEEDDTFLFELKNIRETGLTLDKTNFIHAGWFKFELYNDGELVEKNKFFLPREF